MLESVAPFLKEFGFPVALCVVLLLAIRQQNAQLVKAYTDRINVLERLVRELQQQVAHLQEANTRRTEEYANSLKDVAGRYAASTHEVWSTLCEVLPVLRRLCDSIAVRPCMHEYQPHQHPPRPPSGAELPADPKDRPTDKEYRHG